HPAGQVGAAGSCFRSGEGLMAAMTPTRGPRLQSRQLIHEHAEHLRVEDQGEYTMRVLGARRRDGVWEGWLEFESAGGVKRTPIETTQSSRHALEFWATGLEPVYLEGAFRRA